MVYRPTVRYDEIFRTYVDALFQATHLDRNQIIRGALFTAAYSKEFHKLLKPYQRGDVPLPSPIWSLEQNSLWLEQSPKAKKKGKGVNVEHTREGEIKKDNRNTVREIPGEKKQQIQFQQADKQGRSIPSQPIKVTGGLVFKLE